MAQAMARTGADSPDWRAVMRASLARSAALIGALALALLGLALALALASYSPADNAWNSVSGSVNHNLAGPGGALTADALYSFFGLGAWLLVPLLLALARRLWIAEPQPHWKRQLLLTLLAALIFGGAAQLLLARFAVGLPAGWGGAPGLLLQLGVDQAGSAAGAPLAVSLGGGLLLLIAGLALLKPALALGRPLLRWPGLPRRTAPAEGEEPAAPVLSRKERRARAQAAPPRPVVEEDHRPPPTITDRQPKPRAATFASGARQGDFLSSFTLPSVDLLDPAPPTEAPKLDKAALERNARLLESVLDDFNVKGQITAVRPGPVVTMYELEPAPGIKASRVVQLAEDIARNMSALSARVSVIPGRTVMGIELPNHNREPVVLHELVASGAFAQQKGLSIILGKNIAGDPVIADLAPMPHLLVAGTTGSGKSVGLNCMILSLLYRLTPDECRLIMIDPKMLELSTYDGIPHLLSPVVTEPAKAIRALKWAVEQMEERYRMMSSVGVRNLASFNERVKAAATKGQPLGRRVQVGYNPATGQPEYEEERLDFEPLPQIVVVVDELADLMMTAGKEVEFLIQRLAQKARAAGIHLIMATQRPSVDVITGVIKANLPTRISFHVTSKIDSRTILGEQGAEQLLGRGDMLYMAGGKGVTRIHGPFVSDDEVRRVADHWRAQGTPDYIQAVTEEPEDGSFALDGLDPSDSEEDQQFRAACQLVCESQKASTSWLQRQLRVGYNSAARLIERMEKEGIVSAPDHVGRREVLRDRNGEAA